MPSVLSFKKIDDLRAEKKISISRFVKDLGISRKTYYDWKNGSDHSGSRQPSVITPVYPERANTSPPSQLPSIKTYSGNTSSRVFHHSGCRYYNCKNCTISFNGRDAAVAAGYKPCGVCNP